MREQIGRNRRLLVLVLSLRQRGDQSPDVRQNGDVPVVVVQRRQLRQAGMQPVLIALGVADHIQVCRRQSQPAANLRIFAVGIGGIASRRGDRDQGVVAVISAEQKYAHQRLIIRGARILGERIHLAEAAHQTGGAQGPEGAARDAQELSSGRYQHDISAPRCSRTRKRPDKSPPALAPYSPPLRIR